MRYYINYGTGRGNEFVNGTIEEAQRAAEEGLAYTEQSVMLQTDDGEDIAVLPWYGVTPEEDDIVTARFGNHGFYGGWVFA